MKTPVRILFSGSLLLTAILTSGFVSSPDETGKSSPQYEGIIVIPGLTDSVRVYRDERGMPHIYATNEHDLYLTVGYVSAQDRLWQMDLVRRSSAGRLSEIFGKSFVQADIFSRCLQIKEKSRQILENEDPVIVACLQAYVDGVNDFISAPGRKLPVEFRILSYEPDPWCLEDVLSIIGLMGWTLDSKNLTGELFVYQLINQVGPQKASQLIPDWKTATNIVYPGFEIDDKLITGTASFVSSFDRVMALGVTAFSGSNNWAVAGYRTETGKPLLSNDMHLSLGAPGIWMQMHQVIPGKLNVTGVMIPGEPFIVVGHNDKIAWGISNLRVDDVDLYAEKINPENPGQYLLNGGWKDIVSKNEIITVKGAKQDTIAIRFTHRGPIISGLMNLDNVSLKVKWLGYEFLQGLNDFDDIALSMKWSGYDASDEVRTIYLLNRADGWDDFRSALETFRAISQNFVFADTDGNIGLNVAGGIPIRKGDGIIIRNGETDEYDRQGYVPFNQLPYIFNPENGQVSSANNKTTGDDYPYFISHSFDVPYRINRIRQMLDEKKVFGVEDFKRMIVDQHSDFARLLTPWIVMLNDRKSELTPEETYALTALTDWDYDMNPGLIAPTVFEFFRISFKRNLLTDELGSLYDQLWDVASEYYVYRLLMEGPDDWVDNVSTAEVETIDDIVFKSFREGIATLTKEYGKDPGQWVWGKIHTITFMHPLGSVKILGSLFHLNSSTFPVGGNDHTVCPYFTYKPDFEAVNGASMRYIYNTADWDESYSVVPGGASGVPHSEFYLSQIDTYIEGKFYKDHFSAQAVLSSAKYTLILKPQK